MIIESELRTIKAIIRSIIISAGGLISVNQLIHDFRLIENTEIPFEHFGYPTMTSFLASIPDCMEVSLRFLISGGENTYLTFRSRGGVLKQSVL